MNRNGITRLLFNSDVDSGSSLSEFNDDVSDPDWVDDKEDGNQNIYENNYTSYNNESDNGITDNNWTEHFYEPQTNAHITFNPHNLPVGVNGSFRDIAFS